MKKALLLLSVFLIAVSSVLSQDLNALDEKNGFRSFKFGTSLDSIENLTLTEDNGAIKYYKRAYENLNIGDYKLSSVSYGFYKGKMCCIILMTKGYYDSSGILDVIEYMYGHGIQKSSRAGAYEWIGKKVELFFNGNSKSSDAVIAFLSVELSRQQKSDKKANIQKAAGDM